MMEVEATPAVADVFHIAIVGFGARGLQGFERILAHVRASSISRHMCVHLIDMHDVTGRGSAWSAAAPSSFLTNNLSLTEINLFGQTPPPVVPAVGFLQWRNYDRSPAPRREVGDYLEACFRALLDARPHSVDVQMHRARVSAIQPFGASARIFLDDPANSNRWIDCDQVLLATGPSLVSRAASDDPSPYDENGGAAQVLDSCEAGQAVGLRGFGLAALDAILYLTEGRGGRFIDADDSLSYMPSGREPRLLPFSRTGTPPLPAFHREGATFTLGVLTPQRLLALREAKSRLDWQQVTTLIDDELQTQHQDALQRLVQEPSDCAIALDRIGIEPHAWLFLPRVPAAQHDRWLPWYLKRLLTSSDEPHLHAWRCALSSWYEIGLAIEELGRAGCIESVAQSRLRFELAPVMRRIAFGAHPQSIRKLVALIEAGVVKVNVARSPEVQRQAHGRSVLSVRGVASEVVDVVLDCRLRRLSVPVPEGTAADGNATAPFTSHCVTIVSRSLLDDWSLACDASVNCWAQAISMVAGRGLLRAAPVQVPAYLT